MKTSTGFLSVAAVLGLAACHKTTREDPGMPGDFSLAGVARIMSELPLGAEHIDEVYDAVSASSYNGYDEEYMLSDLFSNPGAGVGDRDVLSRAKGYDRPLRDLFADYFDSQAYSKAGDAEGLMRMLGESDIQIYWPYSEEWDGESFPVITFDPGNGMDSNIGYELRSDGMGGTVAETVLVTEDMAGKRPVWVINRNDDSGYTPVSIFGDDVFPLRKDDPAVRQDAGDACRPCGGLGAGPNPGFLAAVSGGRGPERSGLSEEQRKVLKIRSFKMLRNYDNWFSGASEFWIKCGAVDGFRATKDEDLGKYTPSVTDCVVVVKRSQLGRNLPLGIMLLSDFTDQMDKIAFLITEDDGGTVTEWKCEAVVKYKSKSYGFDINLPYRSKDDIVWRGQLGYDYLSSSRFTETRLGDVVVTFEMN